MTQSTPFSTTVEPPAEPLAKAAKTKGSRYGWAWAPGVFGLLTLLMFADLLFTSTRVVSHFVADLAMQFIPWRAFGFGELSHGNLPLWNPHIYGGAPYFAGFQAALLYPPNWLHLILPIGTAINWICALHVFLAGYFTYFWCRGRSVSRGGSILAGIMFMFCGQYFLHLYAGHLPHIAVMVWAPLMLLTLDRLATTGNPRWMLLGIFATAMQILAGHPQYVYFTGMILGIYLVFLLIDSLYRVSLIVGFVAMYFGAVLLTAMQLLPGMQAASEQVRSAGLAYEVASTFSLPPFHFITALIPSFFGWLPPSTEGPAQGAFWGTAYLWEVSIFVSITGLMLAIYAVLNVTPDLPAERKSNQILRAVSGVSSLHRRKINVLLVLIGITLVLALGRHTPLYYPMYKLLPMYGSFRGAVKFAYLTSLFVALLAGMGFDSVLRNRVISWLHIYWILLLAITLSTLGLVISSSANAGADSAWAHFVRSISMDAEESQESWFSVKERKGESWDAMSESTITNIAVAGRHAANVTFLASGTLVGIAALFWLSRVDRRAPYLLIVLTAVELFAFARANRATMDPAIAMVVPAPWGTALLQLPPTQRFFTHHGMLDRADVGMLVGLDNVAGYDPGVLKRFAELLFGSQGYDPSQASQYILMNLEGLRINILRMLRCGLVLNGSLNAPPPPNPTFVIPDPLPEALLVQNWTVLTDRNTIIRYLAQQSFNPLATVVLENEPPIQRAAPGGPTGNIAIVSKTTDTLEIKADLPSAGILLITDNYSTGWRVNPIIAGQTNYVVMPANYTLMGIPLEKGSHHFVLEYSPAAFRIGRIISIISLLTFVGVTFLALRRVRSPAAGSLPAG